MINRIMAGAVQAIINPLLLFFFMQYPLKKVMLTCSFEEKWPARTSLTSHFHLFASHCCNTFILLKLLLMRRCQT